MSKFCLYSDSAAKAPCMFQQMCKYSYLDDFLKNIKQGKETPYSIPIQIECIKTDSQLCTPEIIHTKCINCMYCVFGCTGNRILVKNLHPERMCVDISSEEINNVSKQLLPSLFKGEFIKLSPVPFSQFKVKYKSFEAFTSVKETQHIAVWGANAMKFLSSSLEPRVSLEVGLNITERDRGGRLDISLLNVKENFLFVAETKTTFVEMMSDHRYESQMLAYESEMSNVCDDSITRCKFLLIGGKESDLLPPDHPSCTGGNYSRLFYDDLRKHEMFFMSANAMLALGLMKIFVSQDKYCLENFHSIITDKKYVGLLSSGLVSSNGEIIPF